MTALLPQVDAEACSSANDVTRAEFVWLHDQQSSPYCVLECEGKGDVGRRRAEGGGGRLEHAQGAGGEAHAAPRQLPQGGCKPPASAGERAAVATCAPSAPPSPHRPALQPHSDRLQLCTPLVSWHASRQHT